MLIALQWRNYSPLKLLCSKIPSRPVPSPPLRSRPLKPARGSGERCKLPQWGLGRSPSRQRFRCILRV